MSRDFKDIVYMVEKKKPNIFSPLMTFVTKTTCLSGFIHVGPVVTDWSGK